ncbi:MAG: hypothetical protein WBA34_11820 [Candidatus Deferrimicrobiaceae bacterium]
MGYPLFLFPEALCRGRTTLVLRDLGAFYTGPAADGTTGLSGVEWESMQSRENMQYSRRRVIAAIGRHFAPGSGLR